MCKKPLIFSIKDSKLSVPYLSFSCGSLSTNPLVRFTNNNSTQTLKRLNSVPLIKTFVSQTKVFIKHQVTLTFCKEAPFKGFKVIRPLLNCSRHLITKICQHEKIPIYPDLSNQTVQYSRNRMRKQILPSLKIFFNPQTEDAIFRFAELVMKEQSFLSGLLITKTSLLSSQ